MADTIKKREQRLLNFREKFQRYAKAHGLTHIPDRGFCISGKSTWPKPAVGNTYTMCFTSKAKAVRAGQLLANGTRENVDLVQVQNRGEDRFMAGEIIPDEDVKEGPFLDEETLEHHRHFDSALLPKIDEKIFEGGGWANVNDLPGGAEYVQSLLDRNIMEYEDGFVRRKR